MDGVGMQHEKSGELQFRDVASVTRREMAQARELASTCDCERITTMFSTLDDQKAAVVRKIGFGGLLKLPHHESLDLDLTLWLYKVLDYKTMTLQLDGGARLPLRCVDVNLVLGIPFEGELHQSSRQSSEAVTAFKKKLSEDGVQTSLTLAYLEGIIRKAYDAECMEDEMDRLKIAIVMYSLSYFLAPELKHEFPASLICNFIPLVQPEKINWAQLVLWTICKCAMYVQNKLLDESKKIVMFGCSLLLQVFYLDNLNFGPASPYHIVLPRARIYLPSIISDLSKQDIKGHSDYQELVFGKKEAKHGRDVCYSRGWRDHISLYRNQPSTYQDSFMESLEILTRGLGLLEHFDGHLNNCVLGTCRPTEEQTKEYQLTLEGFRTKNKQVIDELSKQAALYVKTSILNLYHHHIPGVVDSEKGKGNEDMIGGSPAKRTRNPGDFSSNKCYKQIVQGTPLRNKIMIKTAELHYATTNAVTETPSYQELRRIAVRSYGQHSGSTSTNAAAEYEKKRVPSHSDFPISCFDLVFNHPVVDRTDKLKTYYWMKDRNLPRDELQRDWIVFKSPTPIVIPGHIMQHCFKVKGSFTVGIVDAIMVLWNYLDKKVYKYFQGEEETHKRWRHFLPASFAETVLDGYDYLNAEAIRGSFLGEHITYNIADCQMIILPVFVATTWSCYFWDFQQKKITVLDPMLMTCCKSRSKAKHENCVKLLHTALFRCKDEFFIGWDVDDAGWEADYVTDIDKKCKIQNSGLYTVHYARAFNGSGLAFNLKEHNEATLLEARGEIAHQMFTCADNSGYKPFDLMELIGYY